MEKLKEINGTLYREYKIVILSINKEENNLKSERNYLNNKLFNPFKNKYYNLYITSDEEIKDNDWFIKMNDYPNSKPTLYQESKQPFMNSKWLNCPDVVDCFKVIATTDSSLTTLCGNCNELGGTCKYGKCLQSNIPFKIPQQFIEEYINKYNKGIVIEKILVEYQEYTRDIQDCIGMDGEPNGVDFHVYEVKISKNNTLSIERMKDSYSREEVVTKCLKMQFDYTEYKKSCHYGPNMREIAEWTNNWIEENL